MADPVDRAAAQLAAAVERITESAVDFILAQGSGLARGDAALLVSQIDFDNFVLNELGLADDLAKLEASFLATLKDIEMFAPISDTVLQALIDVNQATFFEYAGTFSSTLKQELTNSVLAGASRQEMLATVRAAPNISTANAKTLVDTTLRTFGRSVTSAMAEFVEPGAKYVYIGPQDDKTRPVCIEMGAAGALTEEQINTRYPGAFVDGGGFNCRHRWTLQTPLSNKLSNQEKAKSELKAQGITPGSSKTLLEQRLERAEA